MSANKNTMLVYACQPHTLYERKYKKYIHKVGIIPCKNCMYDRDDDIDICIPIPYTSMYLRTYDLSLQ